MLLLAALAVQSATVMDCSSRVDREWRALYAARHSVSEIEVLNAFDDSPSASAVKTKPNDSQRTKIVEQAVALADQCAVDPIVGDDVRLIVGTILINARDKRAVDVLEAKLPMETSPYFGLYVKLLFDAALDAGDTKRFTSIRDQIIDRHSQVLRAQGWRDLGRIKGKLYQGDLLRSSNNDVALIVAAPFGNGAPSTITFTGLGLVPPDPDGTRRFGCGIEQGLNLVGATDADVTKTIEAALSERLDDGWGEDDDSPPRFCTNADALFPAFRPVATLTSNLHGGGELIEEDLTAMLQGTLQQRELAVETIIAHPERVEPTNLIFVAQHLFARGDRAQGAFWFYVWQIRSAPWAQFGSPDGAAALRGALNATVGPLFNEWAGSDLPAMVDLMARASRFEAKAPLYGKRPDGVSAQKWADAVMKQRASHSEAALRRGLAQALQDPERGYRVRREAGLYVGPWQAPGTPLPDSWQ